MAVVTLLFVLSYSAWLVRAQNATQCPPVSGKPGCVCQHPDGIIDLTKIANCNGTPRFSEGLEDENDYSYDFNPCYKYSDVQCTDAYVCQIPNFNPTSSYVVANADEKIMIDPNDARGNVYLHYLGPGTFEGNKRYTKVYLHCDQSKTTPEVTAQGDMPVILHFIFDVYSCAVCPGGCCTEENGRGGGDGGGEGGEGPGSRGEGGGILLLATAFVVSASTVPSIITMILLVVVIVLVCRSRKMTSSGQYKAIRFVEEDK